MKKKPQKTFCFRIDDPIFTRAFFIYVGDRLKCSAMVKKTFSLSNIDPVFHYGTSGGALSILADDGSSVNIIWFEKVDHNFIAHECFHAVFDVFKLCNIPLEDSTNEVYAYYLGFLNKSIYEQLNKRGLK